LHHHDIILSSEKYIENRFLSFSIKNGD